MLSNDFSLIKIAQEARSKLALEKLPIDINKIISSYNIAVAAYNVAVAGLTHNDSIILYKVVDFPKYIHEPKNIKLADLPTTIFLNENTPIKYQRFALAHALSHKLLYHFSRSDYYVYTMDSENDYYNNEAFQLAAEILVPTDWIELLLKNNKAKNIQELEKYFNVPHSVIAFQVNKIGTST